MLGAVALMTACSKGGSGISGGQVNYEEGYKFLKSLNVSDAKMIYQKSSGTRTRAYEGDGDYYKLDLSGREVKLSIKGEDGKDHNIGINKVVKLSDRILLVLPNPSDTYALLPKPEVDDEEVAEVVIPLYLCLVDVKTEKIYKWPKEIELIGFFQNDQLLCSTDSDGNVYIAWRA